MEVLQVVVIMMFVMVSAAELSCREEYQTNYLRNNPNCNYTVLPLLTLSIDCSDGTFHYQDSGAEGLPSWAKYNRADMVVYRNCTDPSNNTNFEENVFTTYIGTSPDWGTFKVPIDTVELLSCTYGTCNTFEFKKHPCRVLNEDEVTCPSPATKNDVFPSTSSTCSLCNSSIPVTTSSPFTITSHDVISSSWSVSLQASSSFSHVHSTSLAESSTSATAVLTLSINTTNSLSATVNQSTSSPTNVSTNGSSNVSMSLIVVVSVCLTAIIVFVITSLFIMISHKHAQDLHHHSNKSNSSDDIAPTNNFQEVANDVYIDGLLRSISLTDSKSDSGSMLTICEEPLPFKIVPQKNTALMKYQAKAKSNTYVFTANAYYGDQERDKGFMKSVESSTSCSDEDMDASTTTVSAIAGTTAPRSSGSNCGRPTNIDNYMKKK